MGPLWRQRYTDCEREGGRETGWRSTGFNREGPGETIKRHKWAHYRERGRDIEKQWEGQHERAREWDTESCNDTKENREVLTGKTCNLTTATSHWAEQPFSPSMAPLRPKNNHHPHYLQLVCLSQPKRKLNNAFFYCQMYCICQAWW